MKLLLVVFILLLLFAFFYVKLTTSKQIEGLTDISEINRFKMKNNMGRVFSPETRSAKLNSAISSEQKDVDYYVNTMDIAPAMNDTEMKAVFSQIKYDINRFNTSYKKIYFLACVVPVALDPVAYIKNDIARQYNYLKMCYPKTITDLEDYKKLYSILILGNLSKDIVKSELCPSQALYDEENSLEATLGTKRKFVYTNYSDYVAGPILDEFNVLLNYFLQKK